MSASSRNVALDGIKTIAIFGTLMIHASAAGGFEGTPGSFPWTANLFWSCLLRCAVPLFLMCSGALFLSPSKKLTIPVLWKKYIFRIVIAMFFWAGCYLLWEVFYNGTILSPWEVVAQWLTLQHRTHLYYLVILVLVYATLPLTRFFMARADGLLKRYALAIWGITGSVLPILFCFWPFTLIQGSARQYALNLVWMSVGLAMVGYLIHSNPGKGKPVFYGLLYLAGFCLTFFGTLFLSVRVGYLQEVFLQGYAPGVLLQAVGLFGFCDRVLAYREQAPVLHTISRASFCIYLVHLFFLDILLHHGWSVGVYSPVWAVPAEVCVLFAGGFLVWLILRRIPIVKQYLI